MHSDFVFLIDLGKQYVIDKSICHRLHGLQNNYS